MSQDYKDTLCLPVTEFPMKGNLPKREPEWVASWKDNEVYQKRIAKNSEGELFTMPDGPPYANGGIHMGHTLNKCLKDFTIKFQNLMGKKAVFIPGWDCHGLPIEHKVLKGLKSKSADTSAKDIRALCRKEALHWVEHQKEQFLRLGIVADWDNPYLTLASDYEAEEVRELARILENGILYRGSKPVYWCYALQTALAEAEIEYADHKSPAVYVKFPFTPPEQFGRFDHPVSVVIWTTTPWTLPSNLAIALNKDFEYEFFKKDDEYFLMAKEMKEAFEKDTEITLESTGRVFKGAEFEKLEAKHPFYDRSSLLILGDHVTLEAGTGCVHTAPGHGQDDYIVGLKYRLPVLSPVDPGGHYTAEIPEYQGEHVFKTNPLIVERLKESGHLVHHKIIKHSYPHCWRSKTPLLFRATSQWFIRMDDENYNLREKALQAIEGIEFVPGWGVKRLTAMIEARPDWCISRQRNWGVPIPAFTCKSCDHVHTSKDIILKVADHMEQNSGIEAYFESDVSELLPKGTACPQCGGTEFKKNTDILDVWFDSGSCHAAVQNKRDGLTSPSDLYLEGSDQHRGWFQTSLIASLASRNKAPYKTLLTHNFVNDENGRKMSKSLGNYVDPMKLIEQGGAELLRLWTASQDYGQDMNFSQEGYKRISETYRRFRNTYRFMLGNLNGFQFQEHAVEYEDLLPLDKWALHQLNQLVKETTESYERFEFFRVYHALNNFFNVTLSAYYLDILKDRLYTFKKEGLERRSAQTVIYQITEALMVLMAPLTSFLSEEAYGFFPGKKEESVFLEDFPKSNETWNNQEIQDDFQRLFEWREKVSKKLEELRAQKVIGRSLEGAVQLTATGEDYACLKKYDKHLCEFFIVSALQLNEGAENDITVSKAAGDKCPRCWYISDQIGKDPNHPDICPKCLGAFQ